MGLGEGSTDVTCTNTNVSLGNNKERIKECIINKLQFSLGTALEDAAQEQLYKAVALVVRDEIMKIWFSHNQNMKKRDEKELYYFSMEFLIGPVLGNNIMNLLESEAYREACSDLGIDLEKIEEQENDPGLGNGGLGRLAACFMDSLASLGLPAFGCGLRYEYGLFKQAIKDGCQVELPDDWLSDGDTWSIPRFNEQEEVRFGGRVEQAWENDRMVFRHVDYEPVIAVPYDMPVLGYGSSRVNTIRLWSAKSPSTLDMDCFNRGDYIGAVRKKELDEVITKVLYPEDSHNMGKVLRLKQQYFLVSATVQSMIRRFKSKYKNIRMLPEKAVIHINDTHPALVIPELMRVLIDEEGLDWDTAWDITVKTCAYTNHTVMSEALERWPVSLVRELLPRIYMIIHEINERYCRYLWEKYPGQWDRISRMAVTAHDEIRMANLCIVGSSYINGVSRLHTEILKKHIFQDFYASHPEKFLGITNGIAHRRWLLRANSKLADLINEIIGDKWIEQPERLEELKIYADDPGFKEQFKRIKHDNKRKLAGYIMDANGIKVDPDSLFDIQIKRLHEYKRQLLNLLHIMYLYNRLSEDPGFDMHPRTFIFGAKAASGYHMAKQIIRLIHCLADRINRDERIGDKLKVVFLNNYRVSLAEKIIPAAEVSEQISTAGKEASGTGNMKLMLNGALTVGTFDGANVEIYNAVGADNIFIFGMTAREVEELYRSGSYNPRKIYESDDDLRKILDQLAGDFLTPGGYPVFKDIADSLLTGNGGMPDPYMVIKDFDSYRRIQQQVDKEYRCPGIWWKKAIINTACAGVFSSDLTVGKYNDRIWKLSGR
ncbi:MAG: glycogen/starch/alpha-glucan phosphorylase [Clostridiales bacterium]|nr:glycogen/starch/alpha-glucan phosphorylase [Clostridiales bacterium]